MVQDKPTLKGKTIAVTRPCGQAEEEAEIIRKFEGKPYFIPTIEIRPLSDLSPIRKLIKTLAEKKADLIIFMSVNGVRSLFNAAQTLGLYAELTRGLENTVIIAVGPRTAEELRNCQVHVDLVPTAYTSEGVVESLGQCNLAGKSVVVPRTSAANPILREKLTERGAKVQEVYVYESKLPADEGIKNQFIEDLTAGKIDAIVFGSGLCAKNLFEMLKETVTPQKLADLLNSKVCVAAIGPVTAKALAELHVTVNVMPKKHTFGDALTELAQFWQDSDS